MSGWIKRRVQKFFEGHGYFKGRVESFNKKTSFYKVRYEDDDVEEYTESELKEVSHL